MGATSAYNIGSGGCYGKTFLRVKRRAVVGNRHIDHPLRIGDRIETQEPDTWGDVVDIGLRSSRISERDNRMVIIPNSVIGKSLIVNHAYPDSQYRNQMHVGIAYGSDLEQARQVMVKAVSQVEGVLPGRHTAALPAGGCPPPLRRRRAPRRIRKVCDER